MACFFIFATTRAQMYKQRQGGPEMRLAALPDASGDQLFSLAFATVSDKNFRGVRAATVTLPHSLSLSLSFTTHAGPVCRGGRPTAGQGQVGRTKDNRTEQKAVVLLRAPR